MENNFLVRGLKRENFTYLETLNSNELKKKYIKKVVVNSSPGFPCRVSLKEGVIGETAYLLNYKHLNKQTPYDAMGPIYVTLGKGEANLEINEIPSVIYNRFTSLRCYDLFGMMIDAYLYEPKSLNKENISRILENDN